MDRREFLCLSLGAVVLTVPAREDATAPSDLLSMLGPERVRDIGEEYRRLVPQETDRARRSSPIRARGRYAYETRRTVLVNGWVLSVTEARQCALFSLRA